MMKKEKYTHCCNNRCGKKLYVGDNVRYDNNYSCYCEGECSEDITTIGSTTLENSWF